MYACMYVCVCTYVYVCLLAWLYSTMRKAPNCRDHPGIPSPSLLLLLLVLLLLSQAEIAWNKLQAVVQIALLISSVLEHLPRILPRPLG